MQKWLLPLILAGVLSDYKWVATLPAINEIEAMFR